MNVIVGHVGAYDRRDAVEWPEGWPIPKVGDSIEIMRAPEVTTVRSVTWYPEGEPGEDPDPSVDPFVYIVVGPRSPS